MTSLPLRNPHAHAARIMGICLLVAGCAICALIPAQASAQPLSVVTAPENKIASGEAVDFQASVIVTKAPTARNWESHSDAVGGLKWGTKTIGKNTSNPTSYEGFYADAVTGTKTLAGGAWVRWNDIGYDADGDVIDVVCTVSDITITDKWSGSDTDPDYYFIFRGTSISAWSEYQHPVTVGVESAVVTFRFYKHGSNNRARGIYLNGITDIDMGNDVRLSKEAVTLNNGLASPTVYVGEDYANYMTIDAQRGSFTSIQSSGDNGTFNSGFVASLDISQDIVMTWSGTDCTTSLLNTYDQFDVALKENIDVGYLKPTSTDAVVIQGKESNGTVSIPFGSPSTYAAHVENEHYHIASLTGADTSFTNPYDETSSRNELNAVHDADVSLGKLSANRTISVAFAPDVYELSFDTNGQGAAPPSQLVSFGDEPAQPADPASAGWDFAGWYTDDDFAQPFDFSVSLEEDSVAHAKWVPHAWAVRVPTRATWTGMPLGVVDAACNSPISVAGWTGTAEGVRVTGTVHNDGVLTPADPRAVGHIALATSASAASPLLFPGDAANATALSIAAQTDTLTLSGWTGSLDTWQTTVAYEAVEYGERDMATVASSASVSEQAQAGKPPHAPQDDLDAIAADVDEHGNGLQEGAETYATGPSDTAAWTSDGISADGATDVIYATDAASERFLVTIPTAVSYTGMRVGAVDQSDDYTVHVQGAIAGGKKLAVSVTEPVCTLDGPTDACSAITATVTCRDEERTLSSNAGLTALYTAAELSAGAQDGTVVGTDSAWNVSFTGSANVAASWHATIQYACQLSADGE